MASLHHLDGQYLIFRCHTSQEELDIIVTDQDKAILRELGKRIAEIGVLPIQQERKQMWTLMNSLKESKPMVWMNEVCWNEMHVDDELILQTSSTFCQKIETELRQILYQWKYMPCDMVVNPFIYSPLAVKHSGIGISIEEDTIETDQENDIVSHHFHVQISKEEDLEKIHLPHISHDEKRTEELYQAYCEIFDGILDVQKRGVPGFWFAPWDDIVMWTGVQEALTDLVLHPEYIHKLVDRLVTVYLHALDQYEDLDLLALNNTNHRIGSGAYGYTDELPQADYNPHHIRTKDIWGSAAPQIFTDVSPKMHAEFALRYEKRWLECFGLTYYGCCGRFSNKIDVLRTIPNLRKISMTPWSDLEEAAQQIHGDYVLSIKPSPAILAKDHWDPDLAREELETKLTIAKTHHCQAEIVMKDISTVRYEPQRLWEWAKIASEVTQKFSPIS